MMKLVGMMFLICGLSLQCQEEVKGNLEVQSGMEVRRYAVGKEILERAYWEALNEEGVDPWEEVEEPEKMLGEEWLGPEVAEAGFESRFLKREMRLRNCSELVGVVADLKKFNGKAVYDVKGEHLIIEADEEVHQIFGDLMRWSIPTLIMTEVSIYQVSGVSIEGRSGFWEKVPAGAKLLASLSGLGLPGHAYSAQTTDGGMVLEGEVQIDSGDGFVENRMTAKVNLPEGGFSWKTGFVIPWGVLWAQEVGSEDGESTLMMVVKNDLVTMEGKLLAEWILQEVGGAFLREEMLEKIRWKDPEEEVERDMTKPFHEFEVPPTFETFLVHGRPEVSLVDRSEYPELKDLEGEFYDCRELLEQNGVSFSEGDFTLLRKGSSKMYVRLSKINLELFEGILESGTGGGAPRMIRVEFAQIEGDDIRNGRVLKKVGLVVVPAQMGSMSIGEGLTIEMEGQIDGDDEMIELRATLMESVGDMKKPSFKTGLVVQSGRPVVIQESLVNGVKNSWVMTARVLALDVEVDEFLKRREKGNE